MQQMILLHLAAMSSLRPSQVPVASHHDLLQHPPILSGVHCNTPIAQLVAGIAMNMYLTPRYMVRFLRKAKTIFPGEPISGPRGFLVKPGTCSGWRHGW